jgi:hypothetical protein
MPCKSPEAIARKKAYYKRWAKSRRGKALRTASNAAYYKRRKKRPGYRQRHAELAKACRKTPRGKELETRRSTYPCRVEYMWSYFHTPAGAEALFRYRQSPKGVEAKLRERQRVHAVA